MRYLFLNFYRFTGTARTVLPKFILTKITTKIYIKYNICLIPVIIKQKIITRFPGYSDTSDHGKRKQTVPIILSSGKSTGITALAATAAAAALTGFFLYINAAAGRTLYLIRLEKQVMLIKLFTAVTATVVYPGHIPPPRLYYTPWGISINHNTAARPCQSFLDKFPNSHLEAPASP